MPNEYYLHIDVYIVQESICQNQKKRNGIYDVVKTLMWVNVVNLNM